MPDFFVGIRRKKVPRNLAASFLGPPGALPHLLLGGGSLREAVRGVFPTVTGTVSAESTLAGLAHNTTAGSNYLSFGYALPAAGYFVAGAIFSAPSGSTYRGIVSATDSGNLRHELFIDNAGKVGISASSAFAVSSGVRVDDGKLHCVIGGYDSVGRWAFVDGVEHSFGGTTGLSAGIAGNTRVAALCDASTPYSFGGKLSFVFMSRGEGFRHWARFASAKPLSGLFEQRSIWVPVSAGGGSTGAVSLIHGLTRANLTSGRLVA